MTVRPLAQVLAVAIATTLSACGGDAGTPGRVVEEGPRFTEAGTPIAGERFSEAVQALRAAARSDRCRLLDRRLHEVWEPEPPSYCRAVKVRLGDLDQAVGRAYGTGGVVDYVLPDGRRRAAILALDPSGLFKLVYTIDTSARTVGTEPSRSVERTAQRTVRAMRRNDCSLFLRVAHRRLGPGSGTREEACRRLPALSVAADLRANPTLEARELGGNRAFVFYALRVPVPRRYYTLLFARQVPTAARPEPVSPAFAAVLRGG